METPEAVELSTVTVVPEEEKKKPSKGELFKAKHGYSKTLKRNMRKAGITDVLTYKVVRKSRKATLQKAARKKLEANQLWRRSNPRKKKGKGGKNKGKKAEVKGEVKTTK